MPVILRLTTIQVRLTGPLDDVVPLIKVARKQGLHVEFSAGIAGSIGPSLVVSAEVTSGAQASYDAVKAFEEFLADSLPLTR
jgi:hypothetical protein